MRDKRVDDKPVPAQKQEYHVVSAGNENHLTRIVTEWMMLGWRAHGSPVMRQADGTFYQAMVRP